MRIAIGFLHLAIILFSVYALGKRWNLLTNKLFWGAFLFRWVAGISVGVIYTYYYEANDTWLFFREAQKFSTIASDDFLTFVRAFFDFEDAKNWPGLLHHDSRTIFIIKVVSVLCWLSDGNYWVCASYFSLLAFISAWAIHRKIISIFPDSFNASVLAFLFFPSVIFWSSGIEKESLALGGIYFLSIAFLSLMRGERLDVYTVLFVVFACFVTWTLKYYWAVIFFIASLAALLVRFLSSRFSFVTNFKTSIWILFFIGISFVLSFSHPNFYLSQFLEVIVSNHQEFVAISDSSNLIHYNQLEPSWESVLLNFPWALFSGLFRPLVGEGRGVMGWIASFENFLLLSLFISSWINLKKKVHFANQIILLAVVSYCSVLCVFLALSTPNFGTLSRYRVGFLPFFVFIIAYKNPLVDWISLKLGLKRFNI